jgi:hypothetical protein
MAKKEAISKEIFFNNSKRKLCHQCGFPERFCKHTIEEEYRELCPETPLDKESVWQLVRSHAICATEKRNLWISISKEFEELKNDNMDLRQINRELINFKKHMEEILLKTVKDNIKNKQVVKDGKKNM